MDVPDYLEQAIAKYLTEKNGWRAKVDELQTKLEDEKELHKKFKVDCENLIKEIRTSYEDKLISKEKLINDLRNDLANKMVVAHISGTGKPATDQSDTTQLTQRTPVSRVITPVVPPGDEANGDGTFDSDIPDSDGSASEDWTDGHHSEVLYVPETVMIDQVASSSQERGRLPSSADNVACRSPVPKRLRGPLWSGKIVSDSSESESSCEELVDHTAERSTRNGTTNASRPLNLYDSTDDDDMTVDDVVIKPGLPKKPKTRAKIRNGRLEASTSSGRKSKPNAADETMCNGPIPLSDKRMRPMKENFRQSIRSSTNVGAGAETAKISASCKVVESVDLDSSLYDFEQPLRPRTVVRRAVGQLTSEDRGCGLAAGKCKASGPQKEVAARHPMTFEPLPPGARKVNYKQMTMTQTLKSIGSSSSSSGRSSHQPPRVADEEDDVRRAIQMSLEIQQTAANQKPISEPAPKGGPTTSTETEQDEARPSSSVSQSMTSPTGTANSAMDETFISLSLLTKHKASRLSLRRTTSAAKFKVDVGEKASRVLWMAEGGDFRESALSNGKELAQVSAEPLQPLTKDNQSLAVDDKRKKLCSSNSSDYDDFDVVPSKRRSPNYKYKADPVRKQQDRRKLDGHNCRDCMLYYQHLPEDERKTRLKECSRHRAKHTTAQTPEHFWEIDFPTTQECKDRGVLECTQYRPLKTRQRRAL